MARVLFFIEAFLFTALGLAGVLAAPDLRSAFYAPFALSLVAPASCALAVWPAPDLMSALRLAFSPPHPAAGGGEAVHVLENLGAFCARTAVAGLVSSLAAALPGMVEGRPIEHWGLLGAYLALYSLLNAVIASSLAKVAARLAPAGPPADLPPDLGERFGLTPREAEVARCIAGGASYKEAAYRLSISIKTVKTHISRVYEKTGCQSNVALALLLQSVPAADPGPTEGMPHTNGR